jgi:hypothetical protein
MSMAGNFHGLTHETVGPSHFSVAQQIRVWLINFIELGSEHGLKRIAGLGKLGR